METLIVDPSGICFYLFLDQLPQPATWRAVRTLNIHLVKEILSPQISCVRPADRTAPRHGAVLRDACFGIFVSLVTSSPSETYWHGSDYPVPGVGKKENLPMRTITNCCKFILFPHLTRAMCKIYRGARHNHRHAANHNVQRNGR
jgi:hypothetical protein